MQLDPKIPDEDKIDTAISDALAKAAGRLYQRDKYVGQHKIRIQWPQINIFFVQQEI